MLRDELIRAVVEKAARETESVEQRAIRFLHELGHMANLTCDGQRVVEEQVRRACLHATPRGDTVCDEKTYNVQILVVREVQVTALDDLGAEREAFKALSAKDRGAAIAMCVLERVSNGGGGALDNDDPVVNWRFARAHFDALPLDWVS